jgi:hypothetical protein
MRSLLPRLLTWLAALPCAALAQPVDLPPIPQPAPQPISRPDTAGRVVKVFSFEEAGTNPGDVPQNWFRSFDEPGHPRPGFPAWNKPALSYTTEGGVAFTGAGSLMLPTQGGSTSLILGQGVVPVFQNADYLISARLRTKNLTHARATLAARFLDKSGSPIARSDARSPLTASDEWQDTAVELVGEFDQAAYIQLELQLLQPQQFEPPAPNRVWPQDVSGAAWFDDVVVVQLPRIELSTASPCNIVAAPEIPDLKILVRDLTGEALAIDARILDLSGRTVDQLAREIGSGFTATNWQPKLTQLGWYRATMEVTTRGGPGSPPVSVGRAYTDFVWVPGDPAGTPRSDSARALSWSNGSAVAQDRQRFALLLDDLPASLLPNIPELVRRVGCGGVTLPIWDAGLAPDAVVARADALRPVVETLHGDLRQVTLSMPHLPGTLAQRVASGGDQDDPWVVMAGDARNYLPYLTPMLERFGQRIHRWQIGAPGDDRTCWRKTMPHELSTISQTLSRLVPGPVIAIPTRAGTQWPGAQPTPATSTRRAAKPQPAPTTTPPPQASVLPPALIASVAPDLTAQAVGLAAKAWGQSVPDQTAEMTLLFERFPPDRYGMPAGAIETAKRAVEFWAARSNPRAGGPPDATRRPDESAAPDLAGVSLALEQPWEWTRARRPQLMPRPELAVWRALEDRLAGRRVVATLPVAAGVTCYILAPAPGVPASRGGALVAWNDSAQPADAVLAADLGDGAPQVLDIFGNAKPAPRGAPAPRTAEGRNAPSTRPLTRIQLTSTPIFIEGVDVELLRFISGFAVDPPYLESSNDQHERDLVITNPWPTGITGRVTILEPGGFDTNAKDRTWRISPRSERFSVPAGQTQRLPIKISFSPVEEVGPRDFVMAVDLAAERPYGTLEIRRTVEVGAKTIALDLTSSTQGADDLVVEAMVSNTGQHLLTLEITAFAEGLPRSKASVTDLTPGNQVVKRFVYPGAAARLRGQRVVLSVFDPDSKMRVNKSTPVK